MTNPLLAHDGLPHYSKILPEHVVPAMDQVLADNRAGIHKLLDEVEKPGWANFIEPLEAMDDRLQQTWSPVSHMNAVVNSDDLRDAYNACLPKLSEYSTEMGQNVELFRAYEQVLENEPDLDPAQRKLIDNALRDFRLSGIDLPADKKQRFGEISQELSKLASSFQENLLDATNAWHKHITDEAMLAGMPQSAKDLARQLAEQRKLTGWALTLDAPSFMPVMTYAENRELRREVHEAFTTRASDQGPNAGKFDNGENMEQILALKHEQAKLLGFANQAERSLAKKMARSTKEVMDFLTDLAQRSKPQGEKELADLEAFARQEHGLEKLEAWDIGYYSELLRQQRYEISQEDLKPWFPVDQVMKGMFEVVNRLYGVTFREVKDVEVWHEDARFFELLDKKGEVQAQFYFDLYARPKKRGGAWMDDARGRMWTGEKQQIPVANMVCNFTPPVGDKPALLTHREVETLFHEFGHGLQHMLTRVDHLSISGIHGVNWDAVELPSQFMENFCWERQALDLFARHHETQELIPQDLFDRMTAAKNFLSAMTMLRQLEFGLFDFRIHLDYDPARGGRIYEILDEVRKEVAVAPAADYSRFAHGFAHIFAGGYAAGYYSYKWAEVLSADAFSLFEENGIFDSATGDSFESNILAKGGSEDAMDLFIAFRGREPEIDALLRHSGIGA